MFVLLCKEISEIQWSKGESEYDGVYIRGFTDDGTKIRIVAYKNSFEVEVYSQASEISMQPSNQKKQSFLTLLNSKILPAIKAQDVKDEC